MNERASEGATVWKGTAFSDCKHNEITLLHNRFVGEITNMSAECNTGHISLIIATRSVRVENSSYISQLEVIIKPGHDDNNMTLKNVTCAHDNGTTEIDIGSITVNITDICMPSKILNDSAIEFNHTTTLKGNQMHCHCM